MPAIFRTERFARVLDQRQSVALRYGAQWVEVARKTEHVDGHDRARPLGHCSRHGCRVEIQRDGIDVREDRRRTFDDEAVRRRDERQRRRDHLVTGPETCDPTEEMQARRAARQRGGVRRADPLCHLLLEALDPRPKGEPARAQHFEHELLLTLVEPGAREWNLAYCFSHASARAGSVDVYSSQCDQRSLSPRTVSRYACWIASVTGPGGPIGWSSTSRSGVTSAAVPVMNTSSAR